MAENITSDPGLSSVFKPNGKFLREGDICFNVKLGRTLEAVAKQGPQVFYNGTIGKNLVKDVNASGGILTTEDLRNYKVEVPDAVTVDTMGYTILGMPPPSTGTVGLALDGQLAGVTGGSGGLYIIPGVLQVLLNHFILGMEHLAAVQSPRVYPQNIQYDIHYENWALIDGDHIELSDDKKIFLQERGHKLQPEGWGSTIQLIVQNLEDHGVNMGRKLGKDSNQIFHGPLTL